jgi:acyl-CoA reductase-like NAD-dependent aldehyde dehydrogenase
MGRKANRDHWEVTFIASIPFGGGCVNQTNLQTFFTGLVPFGGVGTSGLGKYYGKYIPMKINNGMIWYCVIVKS